MHDISAVMVTQFQGWTQEPWHIKWALWNKSERLLFTTLTKWSFVNVAEFLDPSLDCDKFVLYYVKRDLLKRLLCMQVCSTYAYLKKKLRKIEKHLRWGLFCRSCEITDHRLLNVNFNRDALLEIYRCWLQH